MLAPTTVDPRAWRADTVDQARNWYYPLSQRSLTALDALLSDWHAHPRPVTELQAADHLHAVCADDIAPALDALENGRGFVILTPGPDRFASRDLPAVYWLVGQLLGRPFEQNVQGTLLYDVRDTGQDVRYGARFSVTNAESTFHTDNSFGDDVLDYVGLLCVNAARAGGQSQLVSALAVEGELRANHPREWATLRRPFHVDRRGGLRPGDALTAYHPIFTSDGADLIVRYLRYWIEVGQEKAGQPLTPEQVHAMDVLDRVAGEPRFRIEFLLKPGEMFFINNRWTLHNRTGFEDHPEPERKRHYVRLWLRRRG
jgi:alpha-ketoglutarate-dependent taurine dioxygenase